MNRYSKGDRKGTKVSKSNKKKKSESIHFKRFGFEPINKANKVPYQYNYTTVAMLQNQTPKMNQVLFLKLLHIVPGRVASGGMKVMKWTWNSNQKKGGGESPFHRMFLVQDLYSQNGEVAWMIENHNTDMNAKLWTRDTTNRDNGVITVGTIFAIIDPEPVTKRFENIVPILETRSRAFIMKYPPNGLAGIPLAHDIGEKVQRSFVLRGVKIDMHRIDLEKVECAGKFCDHQRIDDVKSSNKGCGCYAHASLVPSLCLINRFMITWDNDGEGNIESVEVDKFSSRKFQRLFMNDDFPTSVTYAELAESLHLHKMRRAIVKGIEEINKKGGFDVVGWFKKGIIEDASNKENVTAGEANIQSGEKQLHIVQIFPTHPTNENLIAKYDISNLFYDASSDSEFYDSENFESESEIDENDDTKK